jgi:serine-type D-Ala-D-Ala carboxypeptidase/endopeptidase
MLLIPDAGIGVFALSNRTYAGPSAPVWNAATALWQGGVIKRRELPVSPLLADGYAAATAIWTEGSVTGQQGKLAMNFAMDRTTENWAKLLAELKAKSGMCDTNSPVVATGALAGRFTWTCKTGKVDGNILLAPSKRTQIQALGFEVIP